MMMIKFWVCSESYRGSGRLSRTWIVEADESPDTPEECTGQYSVCRVESDHGSFKEALIAEDDLWDD